jgi:hypothetical protein
MRAVFLPLLGFLLGGYFALSGVLLLFKPALFLRLYDRLNPGQRWNRSAAWRQNVHNSEYKALGGVFLAAGILIIFVVLRS